MGTKRLKELAQSIAEKHNLSKKQSKELVQDIFDESDLTGHLIFPEFSIEVDVVLIIAGSRFET